MFVKMYKETKGTEELPMAILAIAYFVVAFLLNYVLAILLYKFVKAVNNYGTSSPSANTGNSRNLNEAQLEAEWQMVLADIKAMGWVVNFSKPISWAEWMVCKKSIMEAEMRKQQERQHWQEEERKREQQRKEQEYARQQTTNIPKEQDFFAGCNTLDDIKARYKLLMRAYHPDTGIGDIETCQIINAQYDLRCQQYSQN